ncbi:MAG: hypothetical protein PWQ27_1276 [Kosmotoga sp.]|nr:hypothetical protein [Kosmotoga sp.]
MSFYLIVIQISLENGDCPVVDCPHFLTWVTGFWVLSCFTSVWCAAPLVNLSKNRYRPLWDSLCFSKFIMMLGLILAMMFFIVGAEHVLPFVFTIICYRSSLPSRILDSRISILGFSSASASLSLRTSLYQLTALQASWTWSSTSQRSWAYPRTIVLTEPH